MNPLRPFATAIARPGFRVFLMIATAGMTLILLPLAAYGVLAMAASASQVNADFKSTAGLAAVSLGGITGIFAAWARLLLPGARFQASTKLRLATAIGLAIGIAVGVYLLADFYSGLPHTSGLLAFAACTVAMGIILLGATLGEAAPD